MNGISDHRRCQHHIVMYKTRVGLVGPCCTRSSGFWSCDPPLTLDSQRCLHHPPVSCLCPVLLLADVRQPYRRATYARVSAELGDSGDERLLITVSSRATVPPSTCRPSRLIVLTAVTGTATTILVLLLVALLRSPRQLSPFGWSVPTPSFFPPVSSPGLSRVEYRVCSGEGLLLWTLHSSRGWLGSGTNSSAQLSSLPWSVHSPPPPPSLNSMLWSPTYPHSSWPLDEKSIADTQDGMCQHMGDLTRDLVYSFPYYNNPPDQPDRQHRNIPIPSFPFPSIQSRLSSPPPAVNGTVPPPPPFVPFNSPADPVAEGFLADGARVPSNYSSYTDDAQLLSDTWPDCFNNIEHRRDKLTSLHDFLAASATQPPEQQAAILLSSNLNTLALSLNFDLFPLSTRVHVPIIVTTIDSPRFRTELPTMLTTLRSMPGVFETTVFLVFEEVSLETLQLLAASVRHFRLVLYFVPIQRCIAHRPYESEIGKSWKIDLAMLWSFHVVFNLWDYQYAIILEDDMDPSMDLYAYHLALHQYAIDSPHIMAVAANTYSRYHECFYMGEHLRGNFGVPNLTSMYEKQPYLRIATNSSLWREPQLPWVNQEDLIAFDYRDTHLLVLERLVVPFACGYTRKFYGYMLNFYLQWPGSLEAERYDHITHAVYGSHPNFYTLVPLVPRVHGDRIHYMKARRAIPMMSACQHTQWQVVSPTKYRTSISTPDYGFDVVTASDDDIDFINERRKA